MKMKWKYLLVAGGFIGAFLLGMIFDPNSQSTDKIAGATDGIRQGTDENSTTVQEEVDNFICPITGVPVVSGNGVGQYFVGTLQEVIADKLGITLEELLIARREGKSVAELAEVKDVNLEELKAAMIETRKVELAQLLKDGIITDEQRDFMVENMEFMIESAIQSKPGVPSMGRGVKMGRNPGGIWAKDGNLPQSGTWGPCGGCCWMY